MLTLSLLSLALVVSPVTALSVDKRLVTIPASCQSCTVLSQVSTAMANADTSVCSDTISSQITDCLACVVKAEPSAFTAEVKAQTQKSIDSYTAACSAVGKTVTPPTFNPPTEPPQPATGGGVPQPTGAATSDPTTGATTTTPEAGAATTTTTQAQDTKATDLVPTSSHSSSSSSSSHAATSAATSAPTGAVNTAVNIKAPNELAAAIAFAVALLA